MGCNCKVNTQIDYLHKKYGDNLPQSKKTNIRGSVVAKVENLFTMLIIIPLIPFMGLYAVYKFLRGETIHIDKLIKRKENVREQQVV